MLTFEQVTELRKELVKVRKQQRYIEKKLADRLDSGCLHAGVKRALIPRLKDDPEYASLRFAFVKPATTRKLWDCVDDKELGELVEMSLFSALSNNPNVTRDLLSRYADKPWNMTDLSMTIDCEHTKASGLPWDYESMSYNPTLTWEMVKSNFDRPWKYEALSSHRNITWEIINANPTLNWSANAVSVNPNLTVAIIEENPLFPWNYENVCNNSSLHDAILEKNLDRVWGCKVWSYNWITWDVYQSRPPDYWDYFFLSQSMSAEDIFAHPNEPWDHRGLSQNPTLTWNMVKSHPEITWDYRGLSDVIDYKDIRENPDFPWEYESVSYNPSVSWDDYERDPEKPWSTYGLLCNDRGRKRLVRREKKILRALATYQCKRFYYNMIERLSLPPNGWYFRIDLEKYKKLCNI